MSTFDRRRLPGPEASYCPLDSHQRDGPSRRKARDAEEPHSIFLKTRLINQANGSGYIEAAGVKIACSVYGPRPKQPPYTPEGTLNVEVKFAPFASHPRRAPLRDTEPLSLSTLLTQLLLPAMHLQLYPKSAIDIYLVVLESEALPYLLSAALTVASAAVADAGIATRGLGVGSVISKQAGIQPLVPDSREEKGNVCTVTVGMLPALNKLTNIWFTGDGEVGGVCEMIEQAALSSRDTHAILAQSLLEE